MHFIMFVTLKWATLSRVIYLVIIYEKTNLILYFCFTN